MAQASGLHNRAIRLPFHGILAWIMGSAGRVVMSNMMGAFLLVFYTDVFGLSPAVTGTLFLVARVVDGINDPLMGYVIDRLPQTRWGRYRPAMVLGVVLTALVFIAMFAAPQLSPFGKVAWAYGTYLLFGFVQDLVSIPGRAIVPAITTDGNERNRLSGLSAMVGIVSYVLVAALTLVIVNQFSSPMAGWRWAAVIYAVFSIVTVAWLAAVVREHSTPAEENRYQLGDIYHILIGNKPLLILLASYTLSSLATSLIQPAAVLFFKYNVGRPEMFGLTSLLTTTVMVTGIGLFPPMARRWGRRKTFWFFGLTGLLGNIALFFTPVTNIALIYAFSCVLALGMGAPGALSQAMMADTTDYSEWKHGARADGVIFAAVSFCTKLVSGLAGAILGYTLAFTGYVANAPRQAPSALLGISIAKHLVVGLLVLLAAIAISFYSLTEERFQAIRSELDSRLAAR